MGEDWILRSFCLLILWKTRYKASLASCLLVVAVVDDWGVGGGKEGSCFFFFFVGRGFVGMVAKM